MQSTLDKVNDLLLLRRFAEAYNECKAELANITHQSGIQGDKRNGFRKHQVVDSNHLSGDQPKNAEIAYSASVPLIGSWIQILFEMKRFTELCDFLPQFYGTVDNVPYNILVLCVRFMVDDSVKFYDDAQSLIVHCMKRIDGNCPKYNVALPPADGFCSGHRVASTFYTGKTMSEELYKRNKITKKQYADLLEMLIFRVYIPCNKVDAAMDVLRGLDVALHVEKTIHESLQSKVLDIKKEKEEKAKEQLGLRNTPQTVESTQPDLSATKAQPRRKSDTPLPSKRDSLLSQLQHYCGYAYNTFTGYTANLAASVGSTAIEGHAETSIVPRRSVMSRFYADVKHVASGNKFVGGTLTLVLIILAYLFYKGKFVQLRRLFASLQTYVDEFWRLGLIQGAPPPQIDRSLPTFGSNGNF